MSDWGRLERVLEEVVSSAAAPGIVAGCWQGGECRVSLARGFLSSEPGDRKVTLGTLYDLASLTKAVCTAPLVWLRVQSGEWNLADRLDDFFPELKDEPQGAITLEQLLRHTSGYPAIIRMDQMDANGPEGAYHLAKFTPLENEPGRAVCYSDVGYLVLGHLLETESRKRLDELFQSEIAGPLGADVPSFRPNGVGPAATNGIAATSVPEGFLRPLYGVVEDENTRFLGGVSGSSGLFGTIDQLADLVLEFRRCWMGTGRLFSRQFLESVWAVSPEPPGNTWTAGWDTPSDTGSTAGRYFSLESVGHLGFTGTSLWYDRRSDVIALVLSNRVCPTRSNPRFGPFRAKIHDTIMEVMGYTDPRPRRYP